MSIAVSAVVHPSRFLFALITAISTVAGVVSVAIATGFVGGLAATPRIALGVTTFFLALFGFYHGVRDRKTIQLDIYGTGVIRIVEMASVGPCTHTNRPHVSALGERVWLLRTSTIWPGLLLLRFQRESGRITVLPILSDCVSRDTFRAISVACRWIAVHGSDLDEAI